MINNFVWKDLYGTLNYTYLISPRTFFFSIFIFRLVSFFTTSKFLHRLPITMCHSLHFSTIIYKKQNSNFWTVSTRVPQKAESWSKAHVKPQWSSFIWIFSESASCFTLLHFQFRWPRVIFQKAQNVKKAHNASF